MTASEQSLCAIGVDIGGTKIAAALVEFPAAHVLARRRLSTVPTRGGRAVLDEVLRLIRELMAQAAAQRSRVAAIGLGICELVDKEGRITSANCVQWLDLPVREELSAIAPVTIEADVRAGALAEALFGAGKSFQSFLYITIGTGISCCLMLGGKPYLGAHGETGTMASSPLSVPCSQCGCINGRTLEDIASGPAIARRFNAAGGNAGAAQEVFVAATRGDSRAMTVVYSAAEALGSQIALLVNVLDPQALIFGGGLGLSEGPFSERLMASTRRHIWSTPRQDLPILKAATGEDAGCIGAAAKAWQNRMANSQTP